MINDNLHLNRDIFSAVIENKSVRDGFGDELVALAENNDSLVVLTADLMESTRVHKFAEKYPKRFIQVGVAEQNMVGIAAGLSMTGKIPVITSFAAFSPGRNWEQIRISLCYSNLKAIIVGSHSGLSASQDGPTHQGTEDIALTRVLPNMTVISPADYLQTRLALASAIDIPGPVYLRLAREKCPVFTTEQTSFSIGQAQILKEGLDASLISHGPNVFDALVAARELQMHHNLNLEVINCHTIKPLDHQTILNSVKKTGNAIVVEEHQRHGGLGSAVCELTAEHHPTRVLTIGLEDCFAESGEYYDIKDKLGLSPKKLAQKIREWLK